MGMNQFQIEQFAGIDRDIANHMMSSGTQKAKHAMSILLMCVSLPDPCALTLLKEAVKECKKEMKAA
ncbi:MULTISPECIES: hypothetical protein [unclassified Acinetobacter]|uniref:hypothetical protein n=1 Tax=unclassified Acinetobacter TaxID=196816 RepID=UPI002935149C|nr:MULTISPECIES: hypothetical protein [unclassified Acinetobacter]WOE32141.1 hypothetical protein QSG84_02705 [Acinetobacter sp. SAAs470]WOE37611.1 hypothetical protein QSG86_11750 [Acinetobacter sp. SAAs474]